jgi:methylase of polypeptide subunit release factors
MRSPIKTLESDYSGQQNVRMSYTLGKELGMVSGRVFRALVKHIDTVAGNWLPLTQPLNEGLISWASLHGWDASDPHAQRLLVRQALLNAIIRQTAPGIEHHMYATPLDALSLEIPQSLADGVCEAAQDSQGVFNFFGELYSALIPQLERRRIGQFWTNEQIAEWMVSWLLQHDPRRLVDVGCGAGNFLLKAAEHLQRTRGTTEPHGLDLSSLLLNVTLASFLTRRLDLPTLAVQNYLESSLPADVDAVICNPPYTRHHHIAPALKDKLQAFFKSRLYLDVSRQGTLAFYFLLKLIAEMPDGAPGAVIVPMEVLDARYGKAAKRVLCQHTTVSALIHFSPQMNAFHKVDVGATILLFRKGYEKQNRVSHLLLNALPQTDELLACLETTRSGTHDLPFGSLVIQPQNELLEVSKWFSVASAESLNADWQTSGLVVPLKALAKVVRGIATGANEFFVLPAQKVQQYSLEPYVVRTVHRNREIQDIILDDTRWQTLANEGRCVWLLYLNDEDVSADSRLRAYLAEGEAAGFNRRSLVQTRKKWYAMEQREIPPIFFTLLTRGNPRFILNRAGVRPINMFLLIYPNRNMISADATELLWALMNSSFSLSRLHSVSRTYGGNTLKVEPRELDNLPVINPLALPEDIRQKMKRSVEDFYHHQQASVLTRQIDELVETLLTADITSDVRRSLPAQLHLLATNEV